MSEPIKAKCSYCKEIYRKGKLVNGRVTHGICPSCFKREMKKLDARADR